MSSPSWLFYAALHFPPSQPHHTPDANDDSYVGAPDLLSTLAVYGEQVGWETVSYERAYLLSSSSEGVGSKFWSGSALGYWRNFILSFDGTNGRYRFKIQDDEVHSTGLMDILGSQVSNAAWLDEAVDVYTTDWYIPFDEGFIMDETGLHFEHWNGFLSSGTYIDILPYWHHVE